MNTVKLSASVSVNKGKVRNNNEDNFYFNGIYLSENNRDRANTYEGELSEYACLYGVFDGMGGEAMGEEASYITAETLKKAHNKIKDKDGSGTEKIILSAIKDANMKICKKIVESGEKRIGTTFAAISVENDTAKIYNVGDSRVYLFRDGTLSQISVDDTTAQRMVNLGMMTKEKAKTHEDRHKLTQHLGIFPNEMVIEPHISKSIELKKGDKFLLCSDGLSDMVDDEIIESILKQTDSAKELSERLVEEALKNGGKDNITAMILCVQSNSKMTRNVKLNKKVFPIFAIVLLCVIGIVFAIAHNTGKTNDVNKPQEIAAERVYFTGLSDDVTEIPIGQDDYFRCGAEPQNVNMKKAEFSSSDNSIIEVDKYGHYRALAKGKANITVKLNDCEAVCSVYVYIPAEDIEVPETINLQVGRIDMIHPKVIPENADVNIGYATTDESVVSVSDNGVVTGNKKGNATIIVSSGNIEKRIYVTVSAEKAKNGNKAVRSDAPSITAQPSEQPEASKDVDKTEGEEKHNSKSENSSNVNDDKAPESTSVADKMQ